MEASVKKIHNVNGQEIGSIITPLFDRAVIPEEKSRIDKLIVDYAHEILYPGFGLSIFAEVNQDLPSVAIIKDINAIDSTRINI